MVGPAQRNSRRTQRVEARIDPDRADRIRFASTLANSSMGAFLVEAASVRAEQVIAEHHYTSVPSDYFDSVVAGLDSPPTLMPRMARAFADARANPVFKQD